MNVAGVARRYAATVTPVRTLDATRASLLELSRRYSRMAHEAEDLAQDVMLSALRRDLALDGEAFLRSAHGAVRRHAAFLARSAVRRRAREEASVEGTGANGGIDGDTDQDVDEASSLSLLSPSLRTTLLLLLLGLDKAELRLALDVSDAALRKRFQALREQGPFARPELPLAERTPELAQVRRSQVQMLPPLAERLNASGVARRVLAVSDPDGHGVILTEVLTPDRRTATP